MHYFFSIIESECSKSNDEVFLQDTALHYKTFQDYNGQDFPRL